MEEIKTRLDIIKKYGAGGMVVCEVGVFRGDFSKQIWHEVKPSELILIDPWVGAGHSGDDNGKITYCADLSEYYEDLKKYFACVNEVILYRDCYHRVVTRYRTFDGEINLIYIDGDHDLRAVLIDLTLARNSVKNGGWICGHDYQGAVKDVIDYWAEKMGYVVQQTTEDNIPSFYMQNNKF